MLQKVAPRVPFRRFAIRICQRKGRIEYFCRSFVLGLNRIVASREHCYMFVLKNMLQKVVLRVLCYRFVLKQYFLQKVAYGVICRRFILRICYKEWNLRVLCHRFVLKYIILVCHRKWHTRELSLFIENINWPSLLATFISYSWFQLINFVKKNIMWLFL